MMTTFGMGFGVIGIFLMLLFWGGLIVLAVFAVRALFNPNSRDRNIPSANHPTAREILDQRYARGEISQDEYERMKMSLA